MKKLLFILFVAVAFTACSTGPESAAKNFVENLAKGNMTEAKKYATTNTGRFLDMANALPIGNMPTYSDYKFKMIKDSISGDNAWVTYTNPVGKEDVITLKKEDGEWKVAISK